MKCPTCKRQMTALFLSTACDHCDYGPARDRLHRGYIVASSSLEYVFRTEADALKWREASGRIDQIRAVCSLEPFRWIVSQGCIRGLVLADKLHEIFPDHRYEPLPNRAHLEGGNE